MVRRKMRDCTFKSLSIKYNIQALKIAILKTTSIYDHAGYIILFVEVKYVRQWSLNENWWKML